MTDEQIEKALYDCIYLKTNCIDCIYSGNCFKLRRDELDYIKRLKADKEQIRKETAKEILATLHYEIEREKETGALDNDFNYGLDTALHKVEYLTEKYGVEVDK